MNSKQIRNGLGKIALKLVTAGSGCGGDCEKCRLHQGFSLQFPEGEEQEATLPIRKPMNRG